MTAVVTAGEAERLATLHRYEILDTPPELAFDDLALLAAMICGTPIALITLLGWLSPRRPGAGKFLAGLAGLYLVALGVAWFAMSAKPGA